MGEISKYRTELMGVAMLLVIAFHIHTPRTSIWHGVAEQGNIGVDIFFFLSGVGMWYSLTKNKNLKNFYFKRFLRIYPAWLLAAGIFYITNYINGGGKSRNVADLIANILFGWSFWRVDDLTFWYVPAQMMMYLFVPFYVALIIRHRQYRLLPIAAVIFCFIQQYVAPVHQAVGHIEIFWSRIPIFMIGVNCGALVAAGRKADRHTLVVAGITALLCFIVSYNFEQNLEYRFPIFHERMVYIPYTVALMLLLPPLIARGGQWLQVPLRFLGTHSLEIYLVHTAFVLPWIKTFASGFWPLFLLLTLISAAIAWPLHRFFTQITHFLTSKHCFS